MDSSCQIMHLMQCKSPESSIKYALLIDQDIRDYRERECNAMKVNINAWKNKSEEFYFNHNFYLYICLSKTIASYINFLVCMSDMFSTTISNNKCKFRS